MSVVIQFYSYVDLFKYPLYTNKIISYSCRDLTRLHVGRDFRVLAEGYFPGPGRR
jgi:hypothetical protein